MKQLARFSIGLLVAAFMLAGPVMAQDKAGKASMTVMAENDKLRAQEVRFKPGDENTAVPSSSTRVVRALKGGTLMRTYADGKTEKIEYKDGEVRINPPSGQFTAKNIGKSEIVLYVVVLK